MHDNKLSSSNIWQQPDELKNRRSNDKEVGGFLEKKIIGADLEVNRRLELDLAIEENLGAGLEKNDKFLELNRSLDEIRKNIITKFNHDLCSLISKPSLSDRYVNKISDQGLSGRHDSIWLSTREIFKTNSLKLGYEGNINDITALNYWAEIQAAEAIFKSGLSGDKVSSGDQIILEREGGSFKITVELGGR